MADKLTRLGPSRAEPHAIDDVVQASLQKLEQILAGGALRLGGFLVVVAELPLHHAVKTADLLLLAQLDPIVGDSTPTITGLTGNLLEVALGIE
jgi:hypothetical protein